MRIIFLCAVMVFHSDIASGIWFSRRRLLRIPVTPSGYASGQWRPYGQPRQWRPYGGTATSQKPSPASETQGMSGIPRPDVPLVTDRTGLEAARPVRDGAETYRQHPISETNVTAKPKKDIEQLFNDFGNTSESDTPPDYPGLGTLNIHGEEATSSNQQKIPPQCEHFSHDGYNTLGGKRRISALGVYVLGLPGSGIQGAVRFDEVNVGNEITVLITGSIVGLRPGTYFMRILDMVNWQALSCNNLNAAVNKTGQTLNLGPIFADKQGASNIFMKNSNVSIKSDHFTVLGHRLLISERYLEQDSAMMGSTVKNRIVACGFLCPVKPFRQQANILATDGPLAAHRLPFPVQNYRSRCWRFVFLYDACRCCV